MHSFNVDLINSWVFLVWLIFGLIIVSAYLFVKHKFSYWKDRGIPFIKPGNPFGHFLFLRVVHFKNIAQRFYELKNGSPFLGAFMFVKPIVVATDLDFIQNVLVKDFGHFYDRGLYVNEADDPLSAHMFSLDGAKWKSLRSKLSPTFTSAKMKFMFPTVVDVAVRFREVMTEIVGSSTVLELKDLLARYTTDVIGTCAFGIDCNSLRTPNSEFRRYGTKAFAQPAVGPLIQIFAIQYQEWARKLHIKLLPDDVSDFFLETVRQTVDFREKHNVRRNDFMDLLIQLKNNNSNDEHSKKFGKMTLEEMAAQALLFFLAGFETSSTTMMFALYELALNENMQARAREEIGTSLSKYDGKLTYECAQSITYIDQIINETLRKYPPVVNLHRQCTKRYTVPGTKMVIEEGVPVIIPVYAIHHDPEVYPDPEKFDPDRFSPENFKSRHPMSFLAFGAGPRNCIGLRFGQMQSRIGLVALLWHYRIKICDKTSIPMEYNEGNPILSPKNGMYVKVEKLR